MSMLMTDLDCRRLPLLYYLPAMSTDLFYL